MFTEYQDVWKLNTFTVNLGTVFTGNQGNTSIDVGKEQWPYRNNVIGDVIERDAFTLCLFCDKICSKW